MRRVIVIGLGLVIVAAGVWLQLRPTKRGLKIEIAAVGATLRTSEPGAIHAEDRIQVRIDPRDSRWEVRLASGEPPSSSPIDIGEMRDWIGQVLPDYELTADYGIEWLQLPFLQISNLDVDVSAPDGTRARAVAFVLELPDAPAQGAVILLESEPGKEFELVTSLGQSGNWVERKVRSIGYRFRRHYRVVNEGQ